MQATWLCGRFAIAVLGAFIAIASDIGGINRRERHFEAIIEFNDQQIIDPHRDKFFVFILHCHLLVHAYQLVEFIW
jgi:hypothetical protein